MRYKSFSEKGELIVEPLVKNFASNCRWYINKNNIEIGNFEKGLGMSRGYISRLEKDTPNISLDILQKVSEETKLSIDVLLKVDLNMCSPSAILLYSFIEKITNDTINKKLKWRRDVTNMNNTWYTEIGDGKELELNKTSSDNYEINIVTEDIIQHVYTSSDNLPLFDNMLASLMVLVCNEGVDLPDHAIDCINSILEM